MARKHILNQDGTPNWDTIAGFKERLDGHDSSINNNVSALADIALNIKNFGADPTGVNDSTNAIQSAINSLQSKGIGGTVFIPAGTYKVTSTINYYLSGNVGITFIGESPFTSIIKYSGSASRVFTNEQTTANHYQYGARFSNFCIESNFTVSSGPLMGVTGLYVDMMNHQWMIDNMRFMGFDNGLIAGVHSQEGQIFKSSFSYCNTGLDLYGDQADGIDINNCWFNSNKTTSIKITSPRPMVHNCMFATDSTFTDPNNYVDIQVGYRSVASGDKIKSTYMSTSVGNGAIHTTIRDNYFECYNNTNTPAILVKDFETTSTSYDGLTIENNYFALYNRNMAIQIVNPRKNFRTTGNKISSSATNLKLIDCAINNGVIIEYNEPFVNSVFTNDQQRWLFGAKRQDFDTLPKIANSVLSYQPSWSTENISSSSGVVLDLDYDGLGGIHSTLTNTPSGTSIVRFQLNTCPVGMVYFATRLKSDIISNVNIFVNNGSTNLYSLSGVPLPSNKRDLVFAFNNNVSQTILIDIEIVVNGLSGNVYFDETLIKHDNNSKQALFLVDTISGLRFTNKNSQVHSISPKIPYKDIADVANKQNGFFYHGDQFLTTISNGGTGYASGATVVNVADASGIFVGDYMYFKQFSSNKTQAYSGTAITGNKVSSISGNSVTLTTGIPFAINDSSSVMTCKLYQKPNGSVL